MSFIFIPVRIISDKIIINSPHTRRKFQYDNFFKEKFYEIVYCLEEHNKEHYEIMYSVALACDSAKVNYENYESALNKNIKYVDKGASFKRTIINKIFFKKIQVDLAPFEKSHGYYFNPFKCSEFGDKFSKYSHICKIETTFFITYYFLNHVEKLPKKLPLSKKAPSIINLMRNSYYMNYRCLKIEDKPTASCSKDEIITLKKEKIVTKISYNMDIIIGYDCETIMINGQHHPYMIYAKILNDEPKIEETTPILEEGEFCPPGVNLYVPSDEFMWHADIEKDLENLLLNGAREFKLWVQAHMNYFTNQWSPMDSFSNCLCSLKIRIFGFNNNNFDNHLIYEEFRKLDNSQFMYASRYNKLTYCKIKVGRFIEIEITDLIKWLPDKSLSEACEDYNIKMAKMDIDIVNYNNLCLSKNKLIELCNAEELLSCLKNKLNIKHLPIIFKKYYNKADNDFSIFNLIKDYCIRDVDSIIEIYILIDKNIKNLISNILLKNDIHLRSDDFLAYISVPQLSFQILEETLKRDGEAFALFKLQEQNEFIIDSYFGGRTDYTLVGEYNAIEELKYYDVTSEYSLAMTGYYPAFSRSLKLDEQIEIGKEVDIKEIQNILDCTLEKRNQLFKTKQLHINFDFLKDINSVKGIFRCNVFPPEDLNHLSTWAPIPTRICLPGSNKLKYLNVKQYSRVLNTVQMRSLLYAGWKIEILFDKYNIKFLFQRQIFQRFIKLIGTEKTLAREENKTFAKLLKLLLNSSQGKLAQKPQHLIHKQVTRYNDSFEIMQNDKYLEQDWVRSFHYLATFIGAESNWILWSSTYLLELEQIYNNASLHQRVGTLCYCDTDSIIFDSGKACADYVKFIEDEEIGEWCDSLNNFKITWKKKYSGVSSILVMSKKCYFLVKNKKLLNIKIKGLIRKEASKLTYEKIKEIMGGDGVVYHFTKLSKEIKKIDCGNESFFQNDIVSKITEIETKRKINKDNNIFEISCEDDKVELKNKDNLCNTHYDNYNNYLKFTCSPYMTTDDYEQLELSDEQKMENLFEIILNYELEI